MPNYQPKQLKFHGEEKFMCRKNTKMRYLMATGEVDLSKLKDSADVVALEPTTVLNPSESPAVLSPTMTPPVLISVPNWEAMDCPTILNEIESLKNMLMVSKFSQDVIEQYNQIISDGKATYTRKCEVVVAEPLPPAPPVLQPNILGTKDVVVTPTPTGSTTTITTSGTPIIQTGMGGSIMPPKGGAAKGSGSAGGGIMSDDPLFPRKLKWVIIILLVGGAYLLFRKK